MIIDFINGQGGGGGVAGATKLVSGTEQSILDANKALHAKTINGQSIAGNGNIEISGGSGDYAVVDELSTPSKVGEMVYLSTADSTHEVGQYISDTKIETVEAEKFYAYTEGGALGNQSHINLGVKPSINTVIELEGFIKNGEDGSYYIGYTGEIEQEGWDDKDWRILSFGGQYHFDWDTQRQSFSMSAYGDDNYVHIEIGNYYVKNLVTGVYYLQANPNESKIDEGNQIKLALGSFAPTLCKVKENGTLVAHVAARDGGFYNELTGTQISADDEGATIEIATGQGYSAETSLVWNKYGEDIIYIGQLSQEQRAQVFADLMNEYTSTGTIKERFYYDGDLYRFWEYNSNDNYLQFSGYVRVYNAGYGNGVIQFNPSVFLYSYGGVYTSGGEESDFKGNIKSAPEYEGSVKAELGSAIEGTFSGKHAVISESASLEYTELFDCGGYNKVRVLHPSGGNIEGVQHTWGVDIYDFNHVGEWQLGDLGDGVKVYVKVNQPNDIYVVPTTDVDMTVAEEYTSSVEGCEYSVAPVADTLKVREGNEWRNLVGKTVIAIHQDEEGNWTTTASADVIKAAVLAKNAVIKNDNDYYMLATGYEIYEEDNNYYIYFGVANDGCIGSVEVIGGSEVGVYVTSVVYVTGNDIINIQRLTQAEYDALENKADYTFYIIVG